MGNCTLMKNEKDNSSISRSNFQFVQLIGKGGFSRVWKVRHPQSKKYFAMKEMLKAKIIHRKSIDSVLAEKRILGIFRHPFFVNMVCAFQDRDNLYLVIDYMKGGDMRYLINRRKGKFTESEAKFVIGCLVLALEYLHNNGVMHRDLKPENILIDERGYFNITDFGISRFWKPENRVENSGTPCYMAPEILSRENHGIAVDYYAIGIMLHELIFSKRPFLGKTRQEIKAATFSQQYSVAKEQTPIGWSEECIGFLNRCLLIDAEKRIGNQGPAEVKSHEWFQGFSFEDLANKKLVSPFIPEDENNHMEYNLQVLNQADNAIPELKRLQSELIEKPEMQNLFLEYCQEFVAPESGQCTANST